MRDCAEAMRRNMYLELDRLRHAEKFIRDPIERQKLVGQIERLTKLLRGEPKRVGEDVGGFPNVG